MKKILLFLFLVAGFAFSGRSQPLKFYYYPSANVYYDVANKHYIYADNGTWTTVQVLPSRIHIVKTPRVVVYNATPEVWHLNSAHVKKYKNTAPKGKAIGYKGSSPNKAKGKKS